MKTRLFILLFALILSLSSTALAQDFSTGSSMMNTGSTYSSTIYAVEATNVDPVASTAAAPNRGRMATFDDDDWEDTETDPGNPMPIGDVWSLLIYAAVAAGAVALRRRRRIP